MKISKTLSSTMAVAAIAATASFAPTASAELEVSASASVANMYLWRGFDLGNGDAAVSGDITVSAAGFYAGVWGSSGDAAAGTEYDLYAGWGGEFGLFSVDVSAWTYVYPDGNVADDTVGDLSEGILSLGVGPASLTYYKNIAGASDYSYVTLGAEFGSFSVLVGRHDDDGSENPTHLDLSYAYNDNLSFTVSKFVADEEGVDDNAQFVVSYSLDIK